MDILIVEDDVASSKTYKIILESNQHIVTVLNDSRDCIKTYYNHMIQKEGKIFDVIILDFSMPYKNGVDIAKEILMINPNQKIIFVTAYTKESILDIVNKFNKQIPVLEKPFKLNSLLYVVENYDIYQVKNSKKTKSEDITQLIQRAEKIL